MRRRQVKSTVPTSIFDLPDCLVHEILARLPMKTISNCRFVCKSLRKIISNPDFASLLLSRSPSSLILSSRDLPRLRFVELYQSLYPLVINGDHNEDIVVTPDAILNLDHKGIPDCFGEWEVLSSCNGLICFYIPRTYHPYYIVNPLMNDYVIIPQDKKELFNQAGSGFGFCPRTKQYKILRLLHPTFSARINGPLRLQAEITTLGTNLWRKVGVAPSFLHWYSRGCFLNGALHWILHNANNCFESVCCYDFEDEQFHSVPGPLQFVVDPNLTVHSMNLVVLRNLLSIFHYSLSNQLDIWMMKNYGVKESWTKEFVIELPFPTKSNTPLYQPIMFYSGEILMLYAMQLLLSYSPRDKMFRRIRISGLTFFKAMAYNPTSVSSLNALTGNTC